MELSKCFFPAKQDLLLPRGCSLRFPEEGIGAGVCGVGVSTTEGHFSPIPSHLLCLSVPGLRTLEGNAAVDVQPRTIRQCRECYRANLP